MKIIYSDQSIPKMTSFQRSIFLAGPTPRDLKTPSWRPDALSILEKLKYDGMVFVPEHKERGLCGQKYANDEFEQRYLNQVEWEDEGLHHCQWIVFWIPRNLDTMPAFTTNVEFGRFVGQTKTLYGRPDNAPKNRYLDWLYEKYNGAKIHNNLIDLLKEAL